MNQFSLPQVIVNMEDGDDESGDMAIDQSPTSNPEDYDSQDFLSAPLSPGPRRANSAMEAGMHTYRMTSIPRGLALIINVHHFDNNVLEERKGSPKDVENLKRLFSHLKFKTLTLLNPTRKEFMRALLEFASNPCHALGDMMILAILSHGQDGNVYTHEGAKVSTEWIYGQFNNQRCPLLLGKPKFFIVQACRGSETDTSFARLSRLEELSSRASSRKRRPTSVDSDPSSLRNSYESHELGRARPTWEDIVIAYSTIPGYASIRDHEDGTWFVQALCETFFKHAHENMLIDLLMMTSQRLSEFTNIKNEKQTCNIELRHMYKRLYFNSDLSVSSFNTFSRSLSTPPASPSNSRNDLI